MREMRTGARMKIGAENFANGRECGGMAWRRDTEHGYSEKLTCCAVPIELIFRLPRAIFPGARCATALLRKLRRSGTESRRQFQNRLQNRNGAGEIPPGRVAGMCRGKQHLGIDMNRSALEKFIMRSHGESSNRN
jgi:hypothetical protein